LLFGLRLWASVCLALYVAFWLELDNASWAGTTAALVCQPHRGASLRKGWFRMIGTLVGAVAIVMLTAWFPQNRAGFLVGLALWGAACALVATLLRNFAAYAAALAGYTAAIIASDELGATGGANGLAFTLAVTRAACSSPLSPMRHEVSCARLVAGPRQCLPRIRDHRGRRGLLDRDRMANRGLGRHLHGHRSHPVRAKIRPGLRGC
jgi:uncharacterized membrane protein YccC